jgi:hypothetical protein
MADISTNSMIMTFQQSCGKMGCPICRVCAEKAQHYLEYWSYEGFSDLEVMQELKSTHGFCPSHTQALIDMAAVLPLVRLSQLLVAQQRAILSNKRQPKSAQIAIDCPACKSGEQAGQYIIQSLADAADQSTNMMLDSLSQSQGLCPSHSSVVLSQCRTQKGYQQLATLLNTILMHLADELNKIVDEFDYRRETSHGAHVTAWRRAAILMNGDPKKLYS